jgi:hypothetical protein
MPKAPPETTESGDGKAPFDPARSVGALLKMQRPDGSFGGHLGAVGEGLHDAAITALAGEALLRWRPRLTKPLAQSAERALQDAQTFLDRWSKRGRDDLMDPFNNPYALLFLLRLQAREAAARVAVSIARTQQKDHNWTVYQAERPASFNTALNVLALAEAKAAAIRIDEAALASGAKALEAMRTKEGLFPYSTMKGHEWMTTRHGSIARDALCELALFRAGRPTLPRIATALERFLEFDQELRVPTKKLYDYFNVRGHGGYYFFFAYRNAVEAALHLAEARRKPVFAAVRAEVLAAQEFDGTWIDHAMIGRAYGTAQALWLLAVTE